MPTPPTGGSAVPAGNAPHRLRLPAELSIYTVGEVHAQWLAWLNELGGATGIDAVELQAQDVAEVDAAGLQLLISLQHALARRGLKLKCSGPSPVLDRAGQAAGLSEALAIADLPEEAGS